MTSKSTPMTVNLDDLVLDINNPRFAELYSGSTSEEDLIEYLLYTEAAEEVAKAIVKADEFYQDRPLWVLKKGKKYIVKDGNRRCSAVKALQMPGKYKLPLAKTTIAELPVLLYKNQADIDERIIEEHAGNLFRRWERIAKALEVLKLADASRWDEAKDLDSKPGDLIKLASFYKSAVTIGGDQLRQQLRRGRGKSGGKTIIYERLFRDASLCGYRFRNSPSFRIEITDSKKFKAYISALVKYLDAHPETTTDTVDKDKLFLKNLKDYGFDAYPSAKGGSSGGKSSDGAKGGTSGGTSGGTAGGGTSGGTGSGAGTGGGTGKSGRGTTKKFPDLKRKALPPGLKSLIKEYFDLDANVQTNSKIAMARVTFECVLKYVIENTKFNTRTNMSKSGYFGPVYSKGKYTDFTQMKTKFTDLITSSSDRNAMKSFDLEHQHQIIHNYKVTALNTTATQISHNLLELIEFLLQDQVDLLSSLDLTKL